LVESAHTVTFGGLVEIKDKAADRESAILEDIDAEIDEMDYASFMKSLGIKESLFQTRLPQNSSEIRSSGMSFRSYLIPPMLSDNYSCLVIIIVACPSSPQK
jgi:hypothetical protein